MTFEIQPGAAEKATWDMTRCRFEKRWQHSIKDGVNILNEATWLAREAGINGGQVVLPSTGVADEIFAGVALHSGIQAYVWAQCVEATVPAVPDGAGEYVIDIEHKNLINDGATPATAQVTVAYKATGTRFTINDDVTAPAAAGAVQVIPATGLFKFNAADAGLEVKIVYRWVLSAPEHDFLVRDNSPNRGAEQLLGEMTVGVGDNCIVYTMMYDASADWIVLSTVAADQPCLGPNGEITTVAVNATGTVVGKVIKVPTVDDPFVGIEYKTL